MLAARFQNARHDPNLAILEGLHAVKHALRFNAELELLAVRDRAAALLLAKRLAPELAGALQNAEEVGKLFDELSPTPPETGVIAVARRPDLGAAMLRGLPGRAPVVALEAPSHSGNIGAVVRVAAAAGAEAVITSGTNDPWNVGALRGSAGLHFALPVVRVTSFDLPRRAIVAVDPEGMPLRPGLVPANAVLVFGSERSGLSRLLLDRATVHCSIPMQPGVSSLNLATSVAVMLYHWRLTQ